MELKSQSSGSQTNLRLDALEKEIAELKKQIKSLDEMYEAATTSIKTTSSLWFGK